MMIPFAPGGQGVCVSKSVGQWVSESVVISGHDCMDAIRLIMGQPRKVARSPEPGYISL